MPSPLVLLCTTNGTAVLPDYRAGRRNDRRELLSVQPITESGTALERYVTCALLCFDAVARELVYPFTPL